MSEKVISFSLFGQQDKYCIGAIRNAELAAIIYPGWKCVYYVDYKTVPDTVLQVLDSKNNTITKPIPSELNGWKGMFARFLEISNEQNAIVLSRDCDSRLSEREAAAVQEWIESPKLVHSMGDHPYHFNPSHALMGGMFGMKRHACPNMRGLLDQFQKEYSNAWQCDQDFLRDKIWPLVSHKVLAHSDLHPGCISFPVQRRGLEFVGKIFLADGTTIEEHERVLAEAL